MFAGLTPLPPDAILGLVEEYDRDTRPGKVSLAAGVFVDETGITPVLDTVAEAEARILVSQTTKLYKPVAGDPAYLRPVRDLVFGAGNPTVAEGRVETLHTPGGTGALRVAADLLFRLRPGATVWLSTPTWPNHPQVFAAAGLKTASYAYLDPSSGVLDAGGMLATLRGAAAGDVVLLHACCHNPTGIDPTPELWRQIGDTIAERGLLPLVDFAYQGFGDGLEADARGLLELIRPGSELLVASSFSKNFSLYDERVGALSLVAASHEDAVTLLSHARVAVRANYSSPPAHGGEVVATILSDDGLRSGWIAEVTAMRQRISGNRQLFVDGLRNAGAPDFSRLLQQKGMFSLLGLSADQVRRLKEDHAVYVVGGGRVNVAGITQRNLEPACRAIAAVLAG
ncbi:MAG: aspartate/tyrosine/aromatic aminotransferase [Chloroflexi bacterium]|nr:aspartate/tyrosine/aromatic aminotransferase [Chloroflexota bacterium]